MAQGNKSVRQQGPKQASSKSSATRVKFTERLTDFCQITLGAKQKVANAYKKDDLSWGQKVICDGWARKFKEQGSTLATRAGQDKVTFSFEGPAGKDSVKGRIKVVLVKSSRGSARAPYLTQRAEVDFGEERTYASLSDFAFVPDHLYGSLRKNALLEPWSFQTKNGTEILRRYLNATFLRLEDQGKIAYAQDGEGRMAVFNTGLVDNVYDDIYCFCIPKVQQGKKTWIPIAFVTCGYGHEGSRIQGAFGDELPQRASYFDKVSDIVYDPGLPLSVDYNHLLNRLGRIEIPTLRDLFKSSPAALKKIDAWVAEYGEQADAVGQATDPRKSLSKSLRNHLDNNPALATYVRSKLENAVKVAQARARYAYSSVVPGWNPGKTVGGNTYFCMPLSVMWKDRVDAVLVVTLKDDVPKPYYAGKTLYSLRMAYADARCVQRVDGMTGWMAEAFDDQATEGDGSRVSAFGYTPNRAFAATQAKPKEAKPKARETEETKPKGRGPVAAGVAESATSPIETEPSVAPATVPNVVRQTPTQPPESRAQGVAGVPAVSLVIRHEGADGTWEFRVRPGDVIGRDRHHRDAVKPDVILPNDDVHFNYVSQRQGRFLFEDGAWRFEQLSRNPTTLFRGGAEHQLVEGMSMRLAVGDGLSFAMSPRFQVAR